MVGEPVLAQGAAGAEREQRVVEQDSRAGVRALPHPMPQRIDERHRLHQVRAEPGQHQVPFPQGFAYQPELQLLEVAQAAVDQLAGSAARAGRPVPRLQQRRGKPARDGVERASGADDPAADDEHVERLALQALDGRGPGVGTQVHRLHGDLATHRWSHASSRDQ